jgi:Tol biopolymer transport system component
MKRAWISSVLVVLAGAAVLAQQSARARGRDQVQLESAITREVVDGDLAGAMAIYRTLTSSADRSVQAQALLRLGQGYKRTGDPQAAATLERALTFTDHPAVVARAKAALGRTGPAQAPVSVKTILVNNRQLNAEYPAVSRDGRYLAYTDYNSNANIVIRDLTTGLNQQVTNNTQIPDNEATEKSFSPDGKRIAYAFNFSELRILDLPASGSAAPKTVFKEEGATLIYPYDWSADGKRIALQVIRGRQTIQAGYLTVDDGKFHVIKTLNWRGSTRLSISPDGAYLAYDALSDDDSAADLFVVATDGKNEVAVARNRGRDAVVGWSADGRNLLYTSEKNGTTDLFSQAMLGGRTSAKPVLLKSNVSPDPVGITNKGDVHFLVNPSTVGIYLAAFDPTSGKAGATSGKFIKGMRPEWSPDGTAIAYAVERTRVVIGITTVANGKQRELLVKDVQYIQQFQWSPDGQSFIAKGADIQGRAALLHVDARTGETTPIALQPGRPNPVSWSNPVWWNGSATLAYIQLKQNEPGLIPNFREAPPNEPKLMERDLKGGPERKLLSFAKEPWATWSISPSPDRKLVASRIAGLGEVGAARAYETDPTSFVVVHNVATGEARRILTAPFRNAFSGTIEWLPDSSAVVVNKLTEAQGSRYEAWIVPLNGDAPRRVALGLHNLLPGGVRLPADGRQIAIMAGERRDEEIQVLERIVPGSKK